MASTPTDAFFFYVGDFKLLGTLVPLMTRRVCTSVGGTLRLPGMSTHLLPVGTGASGAGCRVVLTVGAHSAPILPKTPSWSSCSAGHAAVPP